jgi:hypothetical protein
VRVGERYKEFDQRRSPGVESTAPEEECKARSKDQTLESRLDETFLFKIFNTQPPLALGEGFRFILTKVCSQAIALPFEHFGIQN